MRNAPSVEDIRFVRSGTSFPVRVWGYRSLTVAAIMLAGSVIIKTEAQTIEDGGAGGVSGGPLKAWTLPISAQSGLLLGKELRVEVDLAEGATKPSDQERELLDEILANLPLVIGNAERALAAYENGTDRDYKSHIANPHIWIPSERENQDAWTLVVERDDWPDFGWHLEFRRLTLIELWASD